ncbi:hypothetical protein [Candidatus Thiodiazotropha endoloripes]|uniref:hypothetical protein n=1 Tax=Candidatus Thiodiazotropha endoloripes TaxID=1818881 RepID=UPI0013909EAB|nr:hypothetical protein [Candidatus Thiodiazotropha endoloripes]
MNLQSFQLHTANPLPGITPTPTQHYVSGCRSARLGSLGLQLMGRGYFIDIPVNFSSGQVHIERCMIQKAFSVFRLNTGIAWHTDERQDDAF